MITPCLKKLKDCHITAIQIAGIDNKKENFKAWILSKPSKSAKAIVIPDLEVPGINARAWPTPINKAMLEDKLRPVMFFFPKISEAHKNIPKKAVVNAINRGSLKLFSI